MRWPGCGSGQACLPGCGWFPALELDGTALSADEAFQAVAGCLRRRDVTIYGS